MSYFVRAAFRIEAQLTAGVWTDLSDDVSAAEPITARRGITGGDPMDRVASTGTLTWAMRNDAQNSGRTQGWYSLNASRVRSGWTFGIPIRLVGVCGSGTYTLWRGKLRAVAPIPGLYRERRVACTAYDCMGDLAEADARSVAPQVAQTENALVAAVLAALPSTAQPPATSYDTSLDTYPYALDNANSGTKALALIADVIRSAQAYAYPLADGTFHVENRQRRSTTSASFAFADDTLDDLELPSDLSQVYNHVRVTTHPRYVDAAATTVLYGLTNPLAIGAGATLTVWGDYKDPTNSLKLIGGTSTVTPVATTDYTANTAADGSGTTLTSSLSVTATAYAASVQFVITNTGTTSGYITKLQQRGAGIYDTSPVSYEAVSTQAYGDRLLEIDLPYQTDGAVAQALADYLEAQYNALAGQSRSVSFNPQRSSALMTQAMSGEIGDVITITETMTGVSALAAVIQGIAWEITPGPIARVHYVLAPRGPAALMVWDDATVGAWDTAKWSYA